ncbi:hypothetical protein [Flavobacterium subsaxonicum]|uniref:Uncharacterized protein n=1 Tax=Flavobacterium subsaxonicum WB 4.1-42 = DSM 21790 TaxID=1121898 RepID=A0A0A2N1J1_9FLAO|nr:hypothetical protein [Flavobacterium subsaxonicum]KGO94325.1 hypothetical protein Q766_05240 [Flavobacterium subsaxonicum WB 4.1-42 = DSM 21790]
MATNLNYRQDQAGQGDVANGAYYNVIMPYDDPALVNPNELATFPKQVRKDGHHHHESHLYHRTPVMEGRNITRTDNQPNRHGFM